MDRDRDKPSSSRRKMKFVPKAPKRREPRGVEAKRDVDDDAQEAAEAEALRKRFSENYGRRDKPKVVKKAQVAYGPGAITHTFTKASNISREGTSSGTLSSRPSDPDGEQKCSSDMSVDAADMSDSDNPDQEPWDTSKNYPITLPLRRPNSGNPDILNEAEFGETTRHPGSNGSTKNDASELGLLDSVEGKGETPKLMLFQFPESLPVPSIKQTATSKGKEIVCSSKSPAPKGSKSSSSTLQREASHLRLPGATACSRNCTSLDRFPSGHMGKMLVYKSGAIKLKLGEGGLLFNVWAGQDCIFAQDVVSINTKDKNCCVVGQVEKKAVVAPDVHSILNSIE